MDEKLDYIWSAAAGHTKQAVVGFECGENQIIHPVLLWMMELLITINHNNNGVLLLFSCCCCCCFFSSSACPSCLYASIDRSLTWICV